MSLSAAASALAPNPRAERLSERGHELLRRGGSSPSAEATHEARRCFAEAVRLTSGRDKVYCFALAQACLSCKDIPAAIDAFRMAARAAPDWFAPKEALKMLGATIESKSTERNEDSDEDMPQASPGRK